MYIDLFYKEEKWLWCDFNFTKINKAQKNIEVRSYYIAVEKLRWLFKDR